MRINLDVFESIYTYGDLKDTLDLKRIAIYTRNDERDLQEMVCKDFLEDNHCTFSNINIYKDKRTGTSMHSKTMEHLIEDINTLFFLLIKTPNKKRTSKSVKVCYNIYQLSSIFVKI